MSKSQNAEANPLCHPTPSPQHILTPSLPCTPPHSPSSAPKPSPPPPPSPSSPTPSPPPPSAPTPASSPPLTLLPRLGLRRQVPYLRRLCSHTHPPRPSGSSTSLSSTSSTSSRILEKKKPLMVYATDELALASGVVIN